MKLIYIFDAYCGWCYGFEKILKPFVEKHKELEVEVISGGLFTAQQPLSSYPHMKGANDRIADIFGVKFGENYNRLLEQGTMIPSSNDAAIGFGILRELLENNQVIHLANRMQEVFYQDGISLSDEKTYRFLVEKYGLDADEVIRRFNVEKKKGGYHQDFYIAQSFGVTSFPTLILEVNNKYYDLKGNAMTLEELENNLELVKNKEAISEEENVMACSIDGKNC